MTILAVTGLPGAPGATTLALGLAVVAPGTVLVEADPDGGVLAARLGLPARPGLTELAAIARAGLDATGLGQMAAPVGAARVVVADPAAATTAAVLAAGGTRLADALAAVPTSVVVDTGRLRPSGPSTPLLAKAARVLVVARPDVEHAAHLRALPPPPGWLLVTVGPGAYRPADVAAATGWELVAHLPEDPAGARALQLGWPRRRSSLVHLLRDLAAELLPAAVTVRAVVAP